MVRLTPERVAELEEMAEQTQLSMAEHFETFWRMYWPRMPMPQRGSPEYLAAYERWVDWAFGDLHGTTNDASTPAEAQTVLCGKGG